MKSKEYMSKLGQKVKRKEKERLKITGNDTLPGLYK